jgi:hypothetical protein
MSCCSSKEPISQCPIKMSDGRSFTDYRPRCQVNAELFNDLSIQNKMKSSYESRMFLQENANMIMERSRMQTIQNLAPCAPCSRNLDDAGTMYPQRYVVKCSATNCEKIEVNPDGLGTSTRIY